MLRKLLLSTTCLSACMSLSAWEITQGDYVFDIVGYWTNEPVAEIVARAPGFNPTGEVVIPSSVTYEGKTYPVTELGKYFNYYNEPAVYPPVFADLPGLTSIVLPATLTYVSPNEFENCPALKEFKVEKGNEIPKGCFKDCQSLKEINLKETTRKIDTGAFRNTAIETLNTAGATVINFDSFLDCKNLRKIVIPRNQEPVGFIGAFSGDVDGTQLIINTPLRHYTTIDDPMNYSNVDVYTSVNGEDNKWDIFLPYPFDNEKTDWKSANVPAHAASDYQIYSVKPVKEMFSYYNDSNQKTATVTSLNPIVSIKGVTIEGVAATKNGNVWSAPKAVISSKDKMNVTIDYTVNGAKMQTSYTKLYSAAATDDIMMTDGASVSITLNGRTAEFGADTPWSIYNLQGSAVATGRGVSADCSQLPSGLYIIRAAGSALKVRLD